MAPTVSCFLNLLRFGSAVGVVLVHMGTTGFSTFPGLPLRFGHLCVVVFFVLSGYVIAYTTAARKRSGLDYAIARLSRIYSVLLPALLISALLLVVGRALAADYYQRFDRGHEVLRFALSLANLQESWWFSAAPPTNSPLWSLAYEFWFYVLFGVFHFVGSRPLRLALLVGCGLLAGPKPLLLLPVWLLGVACYNLGDRFRCSPTVARLGLVAAAAGLGGLGWSGADLPFPVGSPPFYFSNAFVSDFAVGVTIALMILLIRDAIPEISPPGRLVSFVRVGADASFSLYVLHHPVLVFLAATLVYNRNGWLPAAVGLAAVLAVAFGFSAITERRRYLLTQQLVTLFKAGPTARPGAP